MEAKQLAQNTPSPRSNDSLDLSNLFLGAAFALAALPSCGSRVVSELPNEFDMSEKAITVGTDMKITCDDGSLGRVVERNLRLGTTFEYFDALGVKKAVAKESVMSWGVHIDIYDGSDRKIGAVKQEKLESLFSVKSIYSVVDVNDNVIAKSEKLDFFGTDVTIKDAEGNVIAEIERSAMDVGYDDWHLNFTGDIDKRLVLFIPCYKTAADNAKKK